MKIINTKLNEVKIICPIIYEDNRGLFFESFNQKSFDKLINNNTKFVQDNHSMSEFNVLRGLHYQKEPFSQGKLVRVTKGEIFDVAVDIRKNSKNFKEWVGVKLSSQNKKQLWVPRGFAHGFLVLSEEAEVLYKTDNYYNKNSERSIIWNDPDLNIDWPLKESPYLSEKDKNANLLNEQ